MISGHFHEELTPAIKVEAAVKDLIPTKGSEKNTAVNRLTSSGGLYIWRRHWREPADKNCVRTAVIWIEAQLSSNDSYSVLDENFIQYVNNIKALNIVIL